MNKFFNVLFLVAVIVFTNCSSDDDNDTEQEVIDTTTEVVLNDAKKEFIANYANIVSANYTDSYNTAVAMQLAIDAFLASPTEESLLNAQESWLYARDFYGQTEAYRVAKGPIDATVNELSVADGYLETEGQINAWPLDEAHIDYVSDNVGGFVQNGLIGDTTFELSEASILGENGEEDDIATGWHAIEFLLWGQDLNHNDETGVADNFSRSGERSYTDYTTAENADRRGTYLKIVTDLLVNDLNDLNVTWIEGGTYRTTFETLDTDVALTNILNGIGFISNGEVAQERLDAAIDEGQENEHSCFSDNTNKDMWANVNGINNIILGSYTTENNGTVSGTSLIELVTLINATVATDLATKAASTITNLNALLSLDINFDQIINDESFESVGPAGELSAALKAQSISIAEGASALGANISVE